MTNGQKFYAEHIKRALDILCALAAMIVFGWLYVILALLVRVKLGSPVIFKQRRPGKDERIFCLYKFRTMTDARDENGKLLPNEDRMTEFGRLLRNTSLDELPEAWNILKGDMSVVGPRPQLVQDMLFMTPEQRRRHEVRPGLTGLAQVSGRNALAWERKLEKDLEYIQRISFLLDVKIVFRTVRQIFFHEKGLEDCVVDEVAITDDLGDYLLLNGLVDQAEYDRKQAEASSLLEV